MPKRSPSCPARNALIYLDADRQGEAESLEAVAQILWRETAVAAYFLAERRGFVPGRELDDWLAAEAAIRARGQGNHRSGTEYPPEASGRES